ncbi:outer membrane protein assembly factor BamB family protein [Rhodococcus sp. A5(2022)]|uniref:outer membrane protein assembly factor BamB family protein n=1 Tax=Rhodococcus sp. A5(2022) TaxID=3003588 RepID=UPI0022A857BC|nr:PQQ-binding-like beta-propeller repeat protein [Rhodococcus sp. A5(2022)]MCZ1073303.1 PQQ-binding-like beta-propeller repeat protein [Rhodococcus sp. A5(2022)]
MGLDLEWGRTSWDRTVPWSTCGGGHKPDSTIIVCKNLRDDELHVFDANDGMPADVRPFDTGTSDIRVAGDTIFSCVADSDGVTLRSGSATDLNENFSLKFLVNVTACDLDASVSHLSVSNFGRWGAVVDLDGAVLHHSNDSSFSFRGPDRLAEIHYDTEQMTVDWETLTDLEGNAVYDDIHEATFVRTLPGRRYAEIFIDADGHVRSSDSGETLWIYDEPEHYNVIGQMGDVLVVYETGARLHAYDAMSGDRRWTAKVDQFYPDGEAPQSGIDESRYKSATASLLNYAVSDGETLVMTSGSFVVGLDVETGEVRWRVDTPGTIAAQHRDYLILRDGEKLVALRFD